jgi:hypothetical protein
MSVSTCWTAFIGVSGVLHFTGSTSRTFSSGDNDDAIDRETNDVIVKMATTNNTEMAAPCRSPTMAMMAA